ncbi:MAG: barnase inhibitor [Ruminococcaceae bacterium]|nr:barnase inhibitor [Oscillospiraceae bacterium]
MNALIDGALIQSREALHDSLARQLALPEWYGRNLDALFDCLTDLREETEIRLVHAEELFAHLGVYADVLQAVLHDACDENPRLRFEVI